LDIDDLEALVVACCPARSNAPLLLVAEDDRPAAGRKDIAIGSV